MKMDRFYTHLYARAFDLEGKRVYGYVQVEYSETRADLYKIFDLAIDEEVFVDPMTVELFTGLRDVVTKERIFEGDVIVYRNFCGSPMCCNSRTGSHSPLCEIALPHELWDFKEKRNIYCHDTKELNGVLLTDGFYETSHHWHSFEWEVVGYADENTFTDLFGEKYHVKNRKTCIEPVAHTSGRGHFWTAKQSIYVNENESLFFGTYKRRQNIAKCLFNRNYYEDLIRSNPRLESFKEKWERDYLKYVEKRKKVKN